MKKILLALLLTSCTRTYNKQPDLGKSSVYVENRIKWNHNKYFPICVKQCSIHTYDDECSEKCEKDFQQISALLIRAITENKEDDFDDVMDTWYGNPIRE